MFGKTEKPLTTFYVGIVNSILLEDPLSLSTPFDLQMDMRLVKERTSAEGLSFLTKTLPKLGKAVLHKIEHGTFPSDFREFRMLDGMPLFLRGYLNAIFNGEEASDCDPKDHILAGLALKHVQQVTMCLYKLQLGFDEEAHRAVLEGFKSTEEEIASYSPDDSEILRIAASLVSSIFWRFDPRNILPKHGPGAVATGERLWQKWDFSRLYNSIHQVYPYYDYFVANRHEEILDRRNWYKSLERLETGVAKVILVPKDSRGPRIISEEPLEYQYIQQGLSREMVYRLEHSKLTAGHVNFTDQSINGDLALSSSRSREYCTMDMKDASDRVTLKLVQAMFRHSPELIAALEATRTSATLLPDGETVHLNKFAPMGSALCFPVEATIFFALCVAAISSKTRMPPEEAARLVYVYGDDIIVPSVYMNECAEVLETAGLKVNRAKSFAKSFFRESCGTDAYYGIKTTPIRLKKPLEREQTGTCYAAYVSAVNSFTTAGYRNVASYIHQHVEALFGRIPHGLPSSSFPCIWEHSLAGAIAANRLIKVPMRWNANLCHVEFKVKVLQSLGQESQHDGWTRVLQNLLQPVRELWITRRSSKLQRRWRPVV